VSPPSDPFGILAAEPVHFWLFAGAVWAITLLAFYGVWRFYGRLQLVRDTPKSMIRSAAQGYVELQGQARLMPGDPIIGPLTRMRCVWWRYSVEEYVHSGKSAHWETLRQETSPGLFLVADETGQCVVDPDGAEVYPSAKDAWYGNSEMPEGGPALGGMRIGSRYRYVEERMLDADPLCALGYFHTQGPVSAGDIDEEVRQQLVAWKQDQKWLLQHFDKNHDGQVDQQEWEAARQEARRLVLEQERDAMQRPPVNVLSRAPDGRDFILSTLPVKGLELRLQLYSLGCLLAFFVVGGFGAYMLEVRLTGP
jgi:hypothetical protein